MYVGDNHGSTWGSTVAANGCPGLMVTATVLYMGSSDCTCTVTYISGNMNARDQWCWCIWDQR